MRLQEHVDTLGFKAKDKVTGYKGVVSSVSFDLYGCIQVVLTPPCGKDGKQEDGRWFDIQRIEVLRGPQSGLYGSKALGGVINIITRQGKGPLTVQAKVEGGSFRTYGGAVSVSGGTDRMHGILSLYGSRSDGYNLSVAAAIGFIALAGVAAENGGIMQI